MQRDSAYLVDILEAARLAIEYIRGKSEESFLRDLQCQDAVIRRISVVGEAARRVSDETRTRYPFLPWSEMISMRNIMVHDYDGIDMSLVWETASQDLPQLIAALEEILRSET